MLEAGIWLIVNTATVGRDGTSKSAGGVWGAGAMAEKRLSQAGVESPGFRKVVTPLIRTSGGLRT